jgi:uncharacterized membrane protein YeaQ/YmgE (transglycosylase-associated protein family)
MLGLGLISFLIVGVVAGFIAARLTGETHTLLQNLLTGVAGAFLGGALFWLIGLRATGFVGALVVATVGSVVLLYLLNRYHTNRG